MVLPRGWPEPPPVEPFFTATYGPSTYRQHLEEELEITHRLLHEAEERVHRTRMKWRWSKLIHKALVHVFLGVRSLRRHLRETRGLVSYWRWLSDVEFHRREEFLSRVISLSAEIHRGDFPEDEDEEDEESAFIYPNRPPPRPNRPNRPLHRG